MKRNREKRLDEGTVKRQRKVEISQDIVYGHHAVVEALQQGRGNRLFLLEELSGQRVKELKELASQQSVPIKWVTKGQLDQETDRAIHQGMMLSVNPKEYLQLEELIKQSFAHTPDPFLLILDSIEDPHNLGSILRTADASGVTGVILPKHRAVGITPTVVKTATGAVEFMPMSRVTNLAQTIKKLKEHQFWIYGTDMKGTDYRHWQATGPIALVIGNEGKGMSPLLKKEVDELLTIPMVGHVQSLNAGVAAGLLLYEAFRKRDV